MSIIISLLLSVYIVKKFNNPIKQIYGLIRESIDVSSEGRDIVNLNSIKKGVSEIIDRDKSYVKDLDEKNSMLTYYLYQARLKNIFLQTEDETGLNSSESGSFAIILIKIHFRDIYSGNIPQIRKGSNYLKDIIQTYMHEEFGYTITFQIENNQIVSIVNIKKGVETIESPIGRIAQKLMSEDEYVYFSIVCSNIYNNSSDLHTTYEKVTELLKYRKFVSKTQIITENILDEKPGVFYFPEEQQKQLSSLLSCAKKEECLQLVDKVFDYNLKKEINEIFIYLLYVHIIDCCCNVLIQLYNEIPASLTSIDKYHFLRQCASMEDYKYRYRSIISECVDYIGNNLKQSDSIVDYIKKYINENYDREITVEFLADKLKITRAYLSWYFKNKTGVNLSDYMNSIRMNKACSLLQNSRLKVKDIAPKVGVFSINTFIRLFKRYTGKTPSDYRRDFF